VIKKQIYQVGGCVRDGLLGISNSDIDLVAVGYKEDDFKDLIKIGKDFPVFIDENGYELALARVDKKISKGYNGFSIDTTNITLEDDLKRRDLTINSIAYDTKNKKYIDPFGGMNDIKNKILRHTSQAFVEDPLRVLRLARFQAKFIDFTIANETVSLIKSMKNELRTLEPNRVYKEIQKVFTLKRADIFFTTLQKLDVLDVVFPIIYKTRAKLKPSFEIFPKSCDILKYCVLYKNIYFAYKFDILLPKRIEKSIILILKNYHKLKNFTNLTDDQKISFFTNFRSNEELFLKLFELYDFVNNPHKDKQKFLEIYNKIASYSPKNWIDNHKTKINTKLNAKIIKNHIKQQNLRYIKLSMK
jgi:tRNA nucleotidyltransferase (CCA-adding enzyme)